MPSHFGSAEQFRQRADQCVAMAKAATSNKLRAHHYAAAERYLRLADLAAKLTNRPDGSPGNQFANALAASAPPTDQYPGEQ